MEHYLARNYLHIVDLFSMHALKLETKVFNQFLNPEPEALAAFLQIAGWLIFNVVISFNDDHVDPTEIEEVVGKEILSTGVAVNQESVELVADPEKNRKAVLVSSELNCQISFESPCF